MTQFFGFVIIEVTPSVTQGVGRPIWYVGSLAVTCFHCLHHLFVIERVCKSHSKLIKCIEICVFLRLSNKSAAILDFYVLTCWFDFFLSKQNGFIFQNMYSFYQLLEQNVMIKHHFPGRIWWFLWFSCQVPDHSVKENCPSKIGYFVSLYSQYLRNQMSDHHDFFFVLIVRKFSRW